MNPSTRNALVAAAWLLGAGLVAGQSPAPFAFTESPAPSKLGTLLGLGDVDGDGDLDLIVTGAPYVVLNDGDGRFVAASGSAGFAGSTAPVVAIDDFNQDGKADLAAGNNTTIQFWLGTAASGLVAAPSLNLTVALPKQIAAGRIDGDSYPDLVVTTMTSSGSAAGPTFVFLNNAGASFTASGALGLPVLGTRAIVFADVDQDSDQDLLAAGGFTFFNTSGSFAGSAPSSTLPSQAVIARLNNDAYPDLIDLGPGSGIPPKFWVGGPTGLTLFSAPASLLVHSIAAADLDLDGIDELVGSTFTTPDQWLRTYSIAPPATATVTGSFRRLHDAILAGDLDGDGDRDVITKSPNSGAVTVYFSDGAGVLHERGPALEPRVLLGLPAVADLTGDGAPEIAAATAEGPGIAIAVNDGVGGFAWSVTPMPGISATLPSWMVAVDADWDGDRDLVLFETNQTAAVISARVLTNGGGTWTAGPQTTIATGAFVFQAVAAEVTGDGHEDIVFADNATGMRVIASTAAGLAFPGFGQVPGSFRSIAVADVDGDSDLDVLAAGNPSQLLLNYGVFFSADPSFPAFFGQYASFADANHDGLTDCIVDSNLYLQTPTGWAGPILVPSGLPSNLGTWLFDFEGDGDLDAVTGGGVAHVDVGGGVVVTHVLPMAPGAGLRIEPVDLDLDGDRDLVLFYPAPINQGPVRTTYALFNTARHLSQESPARPGRAAHLGLSGAPGGNWVLAASTALASIPAPPLGTILIDPTLALQLGSGVLDSLGQADFAPFLPASLSGFIGAEFDLQGAVDTPAGVRLTPARRVVIDGY